jgi:hypothetical protein
MTSAIRVKTPGHLRRMMKVFIDPTTAIFVMSEHDSFPHISVKETIGVKEIMPGVSFSVINFGFRKIYKSGFPKRPVWGVYKQFKWDGK